MLFENFEDAKSAFVQANEAETQSLFDQSDITADAVLCFTPEREKLKGTPAYERLKVLPMVTTDEVLSELGNTASRSRSAMFQRLRVGRLFPEDKRNPSLSWYHHVECAVAYTPDTPNAPYEWLDRAADNQWSIRELRHEIKATGGGEPVQTLYWLNAEQVKIASAEKGKLVLEISGFVPAMFKDGELYELVAGMVARITLVTGVEAQEAVGV